jgi:hypothetical protein
MTTATTARTRQERTTIPASERTLLAIWDQISWLRDERGEAHAHELARLALLLLCSPRRNDPHLRQAVAAVLSGEGCQIPIPPQPRRIPPTSPKKGTPMPAKHPVRIVHRPDYDEASCGAVTLLIEDGELAGMVLFGELYDLEDADVTALADLRSLLNHPTVVAALDRNVE